ncbi:MAG: ABC transporter permease [Bacteroidetes bacterium]|nr:ABC transporter permease [Bacteroidota bacterium]
MLAFKLAFKNLMGAGLRTWLNVAVLSFAFVVIIFYNGMLDGWNRQGRNDTIAWVTGAGQFWHPGFDRFDPYTFQDSHNLLSPEIVSEVEKKNLSPVLVSQATAFPQGRSLGVILKGIDPEQTILSLPSSALKDEINQDNAIVGKRFAESANLKKGDKLLIRWRDKNGTFDAREVNIAEIFNCDVPEADNGQVYLSINNLQKMMGMQNEASYLVAGENNPVKNPDNWIFRDLSFLLADFDKLILSKRVGASIMQVFLLLIALIAIFDTQVLSIFRRQKEIGTYIALGMTRIQVVGIFTVEGGTHSILATLLGALYGIPLLLLINKTGISFGIGQNMNITLADTIYPYYSLKLIISTILLVILSATIVSYLPSRKIAKMKPTDALKGKLQ